MQNQESQISISKAEWSFALEQTAKRVHIIGAWIAIIFDPVFAFTDYLNIRDHFPELLGIRIGVSIFTLATLWLYRRKQFPSYWVVLVPFILISFQNAYTFMLIDEGSILGHCMNYIALFIGGGMFILWPLQFSIVVVVFSVLSTYIFFNLNPHVSGEYFWIHGGLLKLVVEIFMIVLINFRYRLTVKEIKARLALEKSKNLIADQKVEIETKNEQLIDSLTYAKRIQEAILGDQELIKDWFEDAFIMFMPKDIVSGDFYWLYRHPEKDIRIIIAADCTGHGVPAALMTVLGNALITDIVEHKGIYSPDEILRHLDSALIKTLKKRGDEYGEVNDGMDMSILAFMKDKCFFAGAKNPLLRVRNQTPELIRGSKFPIGGSSDYSGLKQFEIHDIEIQKGDTLYIYSDGYQDQFGGPKSKKYMTKRMRELIASISLQSMTDQKAILQKSFDDWKTNLDQTDDVLLIGIQV